MMYFSRGKTLSILGVCLLGVLLCLPNLLPAPNAWLPWRRVHLGLDLRGGSYLLMQVDMEAVQKERLDALADNARQVLLAAHLGYQNLAAEPASQRVFLHLRDAGQHDAAVAALRTMPQAVPGEFTVTDLAGANLAVVLAPAALVQTATHAVEQSIEIVRRRIDETGVVDPQITRQGDDRIVVQLPGVEDPNRVKELLGKTAKMTFHLLDESARCLARRRGRGRSCCRCRTIRRRSWRSASGSRWMAADLTDARAGTSQQDGSPGW